MARAVLPGTRHWPLPALVVASALWGGAVAGTKYALQAFDPLTLLSVELVAATAALWAVLVIRGYRPPPSWPVAMLLGLLEPALAYLGDTFGLSLTSAADGAIISGLESALVVILAALVLGEAISRAAAIAIALSLGGLVVMTSGGGHSTAAGDLCVAGGVLAASLYSVVAKRFVGDSEALSLTTWQFTAATAVALAVAAARWAAWPRRPAGRRGSPVLAGRCGRRNGRFRVELPHLQHRDLRGGRRLGGHRAQPHPCVRAGQLGDLPPRRSGPHQRHRSVPHRRLGGLLRGLRQP